MMDTVAAIQLSFLMHKSTMHQPCIRHRCYSFAGRPVAPESEEYQYGQLLYGISASPMKSGVHRQDI
jgi:hypothetical protein